MNRNEHGPNAFATSTTDPPRGPRPTWLAPLLLLAVLGLSAWPGASATPLAGVHAPIPSAGTPATGSWAWGAFSNATYETQSLGAYTDAFNLSNGSLSQSRSLVGEFVKLHALSGAFAVVNATAPSSTTRQLEARAIALENYSGIVVVAGDFPAAGTYAPGAALRLSNSTAVFYDSFVAVSAYVAFANYTYVNGTIGLVNEHVEAWTGINATAIAYQWPSITVNANGSTTIAYKTAASVALGWVAETFTANFTPAVTLAESPLSVGKSWNSTATVRVVGQSATASVAAYRSSGANWTTASSGGYSLNATANLTFGFDVVGFQVVVFPNGTSATSYAVRTTVNGSSTNGYVLWDGLVVLPTGGGAIAALPLHPAGSLAAAIPKSASAGASTQAIVDSSGFPVASSETVSTGGALATAPLAPTNATSQISAAGTPARPTGASAPAVNGPPTLGSPTGTQPPKVTPPNTGTPPASGSTSAPASGGVAPFVLVVALAAVACAFLGVEVVRHRRKP